MSQKELTPQELELLKSYIDEGVKSGLSCEPADRSTAEDGIVSLYEHLKQPIPQIVCVDSPVQAALLRILIGDEENELDKPFYNLLYDNKKSKDSLANYCYDFLNSERGSVENAKKNYRKMMLRALNDFCWGQHEAHWVKFYQFCAEIGVKYDADKTVQLGLWHKIDSSMGWWTPYERFVVAIERTKRCCLNERKVLSSEDGPALAWRDGTNVWAIDGIMCDEQLVMDPKSQTIKQIEAETNNDLKSIRIARYGWENYIEKIDAKLLDTRHNDVDNMKEALFQIDSTQNRLVVSCPTGRPFAIGIPPEVHTCIGAQAWLNPRNFNVVART